MIECDHRYQQGNNPKFKQTLEKNIIKGTKGRSEVKTTSIHFSNPRSGYYFVLHILFCPLCCFSYQLFDKNSAYEGVCFRRLSTGEQGEPGSETESAVCR